MSVSIIFNGIKPDGTFVNIGSSGMGFYGSGVFGTSVAVNYYQDNTYITNSNGTAEGHLLNNIKYVIGASASGSISGVTYNLRDIPNVYAPLNIRFTNTTTCQVRNVNLYIYDRTNPTTAPSGVQTQVAELLNPTGTLSVGAGHGSGDVAWSLLGTASPNTPLVLAQSPGSGGRAAGSGSSSTTNDTQHDWYVALSASPTTIGSKTAYGLYVSLEYL